MKGHRRRISKFTKTKETKLIKFKNAMVNWINGHPIKEDQSLQTESSLKTKSSNRRNFNLRKMKRRKSIIQKKASETSRKIYVNITESDSEQQDYVSNKIRTTKYNLFTFLPKNLFEQFRRVANFYFLTLVLLQLVPELTQIGAGLASAPVIVIVSASAAKDAFEDWKRHKSDNLVNCAKCSTLGNWKNVNINEKSKQNWFRKLFSPVTEYFSRIERKRKQLHKSFSESEEYPSDVTGPMWKPTFWLDVKVGDIIRLRNNEAIPADMIILSTSEPDCLCYVETKNLDGETNLKIRKGLDVTKHIKTPQDCANLKLVLETENPNTNLYSFNGKIVMDKPPLQLGEGITLQDTGTVTVPLNINGLLLRGCYIRNTEWVIGVVAYTGNDTKLMMNLGITPSKRSKIERLMNPQIIINFFMLFIICVTCAIIQSQFLNSVTDAPFLFSSFSPGKESSPAYTGFITFWTSLILFQTLVPIALYITVEVCKSVQAYFIYSDLEMYHEETGRQCVPRAWNLSDDLGQIEYLFSDKTGTLTRNVMEFRKCSIGGKSYGFSEIRNDQEGANASQVLKFKENDMVASMKKVFSPKYKTEKYSLVDPQIFADYLGNEESKTNIRNFFTLLAVCHTVLAENRTEVKKEEEFLDQSRSVTFEKSRELEAIEYKAQSPDEAALVTTAKDMGFAFLHRKKDTVTVDILGVQTTFTLLDVLEFNSTRKRMSVIVKTETGKLILYCKGADSVIYERLKDPSSKMAKKTLEQLESFAEEGLRTLCLAYKELAVEEYESWATRFAEASSSIFNRELMMDAVADEIEQSLTLIGASAIEDQLQEGVPECIELLGRAGLKIWVLTGDKMETAINIGFSCNLLTKEMLLLVVKGKDAESTKKQLEEALDQIWSVDYTFGAVYIPNRANMCYALVIDGSSLKYALEGDCRPLFLRLGTKCKSVLCCRVSPLQKAQVVDLVKRGKNVMTLAIGDGANDVSMIQAADVGVGIAGQEGLQAAMSSDYSFAQFRYLSRLLLIHGKWSYIRTAEVTLQSFYKNIVFVIPLFWYQIYCGFTSQFMYDYMYMLLYNIFFSVLPVLAIGFFDQDLNHSFSLKIPQIYTNGINHEYYSMRKFLAYTFEAIYQSLIYFFIPVIAYSDNIVDHRGFAEDRILIGTVICTSVVISVNFYAGINTFSWFYMNFISIIGSDFIFFMLFVIWSFLPDSTLAGYPETVFSSARFYFTVAITVFVALFPRIVIKYIQATYWPSNLDICREIQKFNIDPQSLFASALRNKPINTHKDAADLVDSIKLTVPPKVATTEFARHSHFNPLEIREEPSILGSDLSEVLHEPSSNQPPRTQRRRQSILNLRTGKFEKIRGFAFSQEEGMRNIIESKGFGNNIQIQVPKSPPATVGETRANRSSLRGIRKIGSIPKLNNK